MIARFRCGNEERVNKFRVKSEDKNCRLRGSGEETMENFIEECR